MKIKEKEEKKKPIPAEAETGRECSPFRQEWASLLLLPNAAHGRREVGLNIVAVQISCVIAVPADVARQLGPVLLLLIRPHDGLLDLLPRGGVNGVGEVGVQLGTTINVPRDPALAEFVSAAVAEPRPEVVLGAAVGAAVCQLAARHGDEDAPRPLDNLQVPNDERVVERNGTEREQTLTVLLAQLDANLGDDHDVLLECDMDIQNTTLAERPAQAG